MGVSLLPALLSVLAFVVLCHVRDVLSVCSTVKAGNDRLAVSQFMLLWLIVPTSFLPVLLSAFFPAESQTAVVAAAGGFVLAVITAFLPPGIQYLFIAVPLVMLLYLLVRRWRDGWVIGDRAAVAVFALVTTLAAWVRHMTFASLLRKPLDPDSQGFQTIAQRAFGYDTDFREPGYIWLLKLTKVLSFGDYSDVALRLYSVLFTFIALAVLFWAAHRLFGLLVATCAAVFFAVGYELAMDAVRVLREDLIIASILAYIYFYARFWRKPIHWQNYLLLGVLAGAGTLLRLHGISFYVLTMLVHFGFAWWSNGRAPRQLAIFILPLAALFIPVTPYLAYCAKKYNNPMFINDFGMRFYANVELAGVHPDFPTKEEVAKDAYAGGPMKTSTFLFKYHTLGQLSRGGFAGMFRLYGGELAMYSFRPVFDLDQALLKLLVFVSLAGTIALLCTTAGRILVILLFLFHAPSFYLVQFKWFDPRLVAAAFTGFYVAVGAAVWYAGVGVRRVMRSMSGAPAPEVSTAVKPKAKRQTRKR